MVKQQLYVDIMTSIGMSQMAHHLRMKFMQNSLLQINTRQYLIQL